jgi:hypothetical protein
MCIVKDGTEIRTIEQWFQFAPPKKGRSHWVEGRSALECARAWCADPNGTLWPSEINALLASHPDTDGATLKSATPEYRCRFDKLPGEPRNTDVVAIADHPHGAIALSVEAKADESFGDLVINVLEHAIANIAADKRTNVVRRVQQLASALLPLPIDGASPLGDLRYQLLTGVAGALAFARQEKAHRAVFLIHEFQTSRTEDSKHEANARDLNSFVARLTRGRVLEVPSGKLLGPFEVPGIPLFRDAPSLYLGKAVRNLRSSAEWNPMAQSDSMLEEQFEEWRKIDEWYSAGRLNEYRGEYVIWGGGEIFAHGRNLFDIRINAEKLAESKGISPSRLIDYFVPGE